MLFPADSELRSLALPDADVLYATSAQLPLPADVLLQRLIDEIAWREEDIVLWGRKVPQPRLVAWYGDPGASYTYSGVRHDPLPWSSLLLDIKVDVERATSATQATTRARSRPTRTRPATSGSPKMQRAP